MDQKRFEEAKRKIIGEEFIRVFEEESNKLGKMDFLVQGTIYPDVVESGHGEAATIKSHHNVGGIGEVTKEKCDILREADAIYMDILKEHGLYKEIWQAFATLPDVKTVGVMGDERTYAYLVGIRAVTSSDGMTSDWYKMPYDVLEKISNRIVNEVDGANRVVYDITSKPPGTIEWE